MDRKPDMRRKVPGRFRKHCVYAVQHPYTWPIMTLFASGLFLLATCFWAVLCEPLCSIRPYGRPNPAHCVALMNHMIGNRQIFPSPTAPRGFVLYTPPAPNVRLPLIYWYCAPFHLTADYSRALTLQKVSCIVHVDAQHTPINSHHVWHLSQRDLEAQVEGIVDHCLIHGETGWPTQMGGVSTFDHGKSLVTPSRNHFRVCILWSDS